MGKIRDKNCIPILILIPGLLIAVFILFLPKILLADTITLPKTGETTCYDTAGNLIDCSGTGQDGDIQAGVEWPDPRFTDNSDGTMTDNLTGLMWAQNAKIANMSYWQDALEYVAGMNSGTNSNFGYTDWRLPNILEMFSLSHQGEHYTGTWLESQGFTNVGTYASTYWTSTTLVGFPYKAWLYNLYSNFTWAGDKAIYSYYFWPVRAGQSGDSDPSYPANIRKTGQTTCYDAAGNLIDCAGTGQDGDIQAGVTWPQPRFTDNGDGTVKDNLTGIDWMQDPTSLGQMTWQGELDYIAELNEVAGTRANRMPNVNEMMSLMDFSQSGSMITQSTTSGQRLPLNAVPATLGPIYGNFWTGNSVSITNLNYENYATQVYSFPFEYGNQNHGDKGGEGGVFPIGPGVVNISDDTAANHPFSGHSVEPVNTNTGELFSLEPMDLFLGGPMPLFFQRYYASYLARSFIVGDLGDNWRHNFEWRLYWVGNQLTIVSDKGKILKHSSDGQGNWTLQSAPPDIPYQVTQLGHEIYLGDPKNDRIYKFNAEGKLIELLDGKGNVFSLSYYTSDEDTGKLDIVTDGLGRSLKFTYTTVGSLRKLTLVQAVFEETPQKSISFGYDATGDTLLSYTDPRGNFTEYQYADTSGSADKALMTRKILPEGNSHFIQTYYTTADQYVSGRVKTQDGYGNTYTFTYPTGSADSMSTNIVTMSLGGADTVITDTQDNTMTQTHNNDGNLTALTCSDGLSTNIGYDSSRRRNLLTDRLGNTSSISYHEPTGKLSSITRADGTTSSFTYSSRSHESGVNLHDLSTIEYPDGTTQSFQYDSSGNITSHTDEDGNVTTYTYNSRGQVLTTTNPLGGITTNTYNPDGTLATMTGPSNNTESYTYDNQKRLVKITHAGGTTITYTYDNNDSILSITDELNRTTTYTYDKNNNLISVTDPLNNTTTMMYNGMDSVVSVTDPLNNESTRTYDEYGRPKTHTDANGNTTTFNYDNRGVTSVTDPDGNAWPYTYNAESVITSIGSPLGNTSNFETDAMGRLTLSTSPLSNITNFSYDTMGRMTTFQKPLGDTTSYTYDNRGLLSSVTIPGNIAASYTRNALGLITGVIDPNNKTWQSGYDNQGRLTSTTDPLGNVTSYQYDSRNRVNLIIFPSGTLDISYDDAGNVTSRVYSDGASLSYAYDGMNRLTSGEGLTLGYDALGRIIESNGLTITHDPEGRIASLTLAPGKTITYGYNSRDLVTSISDWIGDTTILSYDAANRLTTITRPNGVTTTVQYNQEDRVSNIMEGSLGSHVLTRDKNGQIVHADRQVQTAIQLKNSASNYSYDDACQVSTFFYDDIGHLTSDGIRSYSWNLASQLTGYTEPGKAISFNYDALGHRVLRTEDGIVRSYIWNYGFVLPSISVERVNDVDTRYFVHIPAGMLLHSVNATSNERLFYHFDEIGNTMFLTDDNGAVVTSYAYGPYGENIAPDGVVDNPFTWQGRYGVMKEGNSGLYYIRNRYYDSQTGRFVSRDKIDNIMPRRINPYQYALNNPLSYTDFSGLLTTVHASVMEVGPAKVKWHSGISVDVYDEQDNIIGVCQMDYSNTKDTISGPGQFIVKFHRGSSLEAGIKYEKPTSSRILRSKKDSGDKRVFEAMLKAMGVTKEQFFKHFNKPKSGNRWILSPFLGHKLPQPWTNYNLFTNCCVNFTDKMLDAYYGHDWNFTTMFTAGMGLLNEVDSEEIERLRKIDPEEIAVFEGDW